MSLVIPKRTTIVSRIHLAVMKKPYEAVESVYSSCEYEDSLMKASAEKVRRHKQIDYHQTYLDTEPRRFSKVLLQTLNGEPAINKEQLFKKETYGSSNSPKLTDLPVMPYTLNQQQDGNSTTNCQPIKQAPQAVGSRILHRRTYVLPSFAFENPRIKEGILRQFSNDQAHISKEHQGLVDLNKELVQISKKDCVLNQTFTKVNSQSSLFFYQKENKIKLAPQSESSPFAIRKISVNCLNGQPFSFKENLLSLKPLAHLSTKQYFQSRNVEKWDNNSKKQDISRNLKSRKTSVGELLRNSTTTTHSTVIDNDSPHKLLQPQSLPCLVQTPRKSQRVEGTLSSQKIIEEYFTFNDPLSAENEAQMHNSITLRRIPSSLVVSQQDFQKKGSISSFHTCCDTSAESTYYSSSFSSSGKSTLRSQVRFETSPTTPHDLQKEPRSVSLVDRNTSWITIVTSSQNRVSQERQQHSKYRLNLSDFSPEKTSHNIKNSPQESFQKL